MPLGSVYTAFKKKKSEEGLAYIITGSNHLVEAKIFGSVIVHVKSRTLPPDQVIEALLSDDISRFNMSPDKIKLEDVQPGTVKKTFAAAAPFVLAADDATPQRLFSILRLMGQLVKSEGEGFEAFDIMAAEMLKRYPNFSLERADVKKRIFDLSNVYLITFPFLNSETIPSSRRYIPEWIFDSIVINDVTLKNIILYYIFFGELRPPLIKAIAKKESGFAALHGYARISKFIYSSVSDSSTVDIFKGATKIGELTLEWHSDKKSEILIAQADLDKLRIKDGDAVNLVFN
jgi:hypothetical protein